jgi:hypothetical protein
MTTAPEDRIREIASLPKRTTQSVTQQSVNLNPNMEATAEDRIREIAALPKRTVQSDPNPNMAVLGAEQYPMAEITTNTGEKVMVYTGGPLAGRDKDGNFPIQATAPFTPSGDGGGSGAGVGAGVGTGAGISGEMSDAYKRLFDEFNALGLGALVEDSKDLLMKATSISQMPDALRNTKAYMTRFSANDARIKAGLTALSPASYIAMEDKYQEVMRQYGLPESYYATGTYGKQEGFEKLIASDVSNVELRDRLSEAQDRVLKANPEVLKALKDFYPDIKNGDILAYTLDPKNAIKDIQRKVTAAEIGGAALQQQGLTTSLARAEELQRYGVDKTAATEGYSMIGGGLQRGSELAAIYGEDPYTQATAESDIFNVSGAQEARKQRKKITGLEKATFGGKSGLTGGALARDRAGGI